MYRDDIPIITTSPLSLLNRLTCHSSLQAVFFPLYFLSQSDIFGSFVVHIHPIIRRIFLFLVFSSLLEREKNKLCTFFVFAIIIIIIIYSFLLRRVACLCLRFTNGVDQAGKNEPVPVISEHDHHHHHATHWNMSGQKGIEGSAHQSSRSGAISS